MDRFMSKTSLFIATYALLIMRAHLFSHDPLPSWNEGKTKQALIEFVQNTSSIDNKDYLPVEERIATFDQDGTLWTEKPVYTQLSFAINEISKMSSQHPEWKDQQPYQAILEKNLEKMQQFSMQDIEKIVAATHANMTTNAFQKSVDEWLKTAKHPRFQRPYTELIYQPMLELIKYLKENKFKVYIVSGGGQDFIRTYSQRVYGIPVEQVIGSAGKTRYEIKSLTPGSSEPVLIKQPEILFIDDKSGKPEAIHLFIGKHPTFAAGNSDGDREMLEWSQASGKNSLQLLVHHDDAIREYAYDADSKVGTFSNALKEHALKNGWIIVSMKNDWKTIFP